MKKHLIRVGNSYALVIDKSIRRILQLGPRSILDVSTDGQRIVIQRTGKLLDERDLKRAREILNAEEGMPRDNEAGADLGVNRKALDLDSRQVFWELERHGLGGHRLEALYHQKNPRIGRVAAWMGAGDCGTTANSDELATLQRMRHCRDRLKSGATWDQAIEEALRAFPKRAESAPGAAAPPPSASPPSAAASPPSAVASPPSA